MFEEWWTFEAIFGFFCDFSNLLYCHPDWDTAARLCARLPRGGQVQRAAVRRQGHRLPLRHAHQVGNGRFRSRDSLQRFLKRESDSSVRTQTLRSWEINDSSIPSHQELPPPQGEPLWRGPAIHGHGLGVLGTAREQAQQGKGVRDCACGLQVGLGFGGIYRTNNLPVNDR